MLDTSSGVHFSDREKEDPHTSVSVLHIMVEGPSFRLGVLPINISVLPRMSEETGPRMGVLPTIRSVTD